MVKVLTFTIFCCIIVLYYFYGDVFGFDSILEVKIASSGFAWPL